MKNKPVLLIILIFCLTSLRIKAQIQFKIKYDKKISEVPVTARLYLLINQDTAKDPLYYGGFMNGQNLVVHYVNDWVADEWIKIKGNAKSWPSKISNLKPGKYALRAALYLNDENPDFTSAPKNGISKKMIVDINPLKNEDLLIVIDQKVEVSAFNVTKFEKEFLLESKLISKSLNKKTYLKASVILPQRYYESPDNKYPVVYMVHGFGGNYKDIERMKKKYHLDKDREEKIYVYLHANFKTGHHVFTNSSVNGPWGDALVKELIPEIEKKYRILNNKHTRFIFGHSSGGWSALSLQINYPNVFGGSWSVAPDAIDFRSFAKVNLYDLNTNLYKDEQGKNRFMMRLGPQEVVPIKYYADWEVVVGAGQQLGSLEAVFGEFDGSGNITKLFDRSNGNVIASTVKLWDKYDLSLKLRNSSAKLQKKLNGKINIYVGDQDNFFLEEPVKLFKKEMEKMRLDTNIQIIQNHDHFSLFNDGKLMERIWKEINVKIKAFDNAQKAKRNGVRAVKNASGIK